MSSPLCLTKRLALFYLALSTSALLLPSPNATVANSAPLALPFNVSSPASILSSPNNSASAPFVYEMLSADASVLWSNLQAEANVKPICNGDRFGKLLKLDSCTEAWGKISVDTYPLRLGQKGSGAYDVQLPRRQSSSDGTCVIDVFHKDGVDFDFSTGQDISRAALRVINACVLRDEGGYLKGVGLNKNLIVVISLYKPAVACFGTAHRARGYNVEQEVLDMIPVGLENLVFGLSGEPDVQVVVPDVFTPESMHEDPFEAIVDIDLYSVNGRWFDLWAGTHAVNAICVGKQSRPGSSFSPGGLKITLDRVQSVLVDNVTATS